MTHRSFQALGSARLRSYLGEHLDYDAAVRCHAMAFIAAYVAGALEAAGERPSRCEQLHLCATPSLVTTDGGGWVQPTSRQCGHRLCPRCSRRKAKAVAKKMMSKFEHLGYERHRSTAFLTLTLPEPVEWCSADLSAATRLLGGAFRAMAEDIGATGSHRTVEVAMTADQHAHVHLHALLVGFPHIHESQSARRVDSRTVNSGTVNRMRSAFSRALDLTPNTPVVLHICPVGETDADVRRTVEYLSDPFAVSQSRSHLGRWQWADELLRSLPMVNDHSAQRQIDLEMTDPAFMDGAANFIVNCGIGGLWPIFTMPEALREFLHFVHGKRLTETYGCLRKSP